MPEITARAPPRRFYGAVAPIAVAGGFTVALDARPVVTPRRAALVVPWRALAEDIAAEWRAQGATIRAETMPLTRIVNSAIDTVARTRAATIEEIVAHGACDLVLYRAAAPEGLVARQQASWDPVVAEAEAIVRARFVLAQGIVHVPQSEAALAGVRDAIAPHSDLAIGALHVATTLTGSALIALVLAAGATDPDAAWAAAHVDEDWQASRWGEDAEAAARRAWRRRDFAAAARVLELARANAT